MSSVALRKAKRLAGAVWQWLLAPLQHRRRVLLVLGALDDDMARDARQRARFYLRGVDARDGQWLIDERRRLTLGDLLRYKAILVADEHAIPSALRKAFAHVYNVDWMRNPMDGWEFARFASSLRSQRRTVGQAKAHLTLVVSRLNQGGQKAVYLFGTGPSLARSRERQFSDGTVVVCNTIVRDAELWRHLRPRVLVAGDGIYHFGHTEHARAFRRDAATRLRATPECVFVYPALFHPVVSQEFTGLDDQLIPIPIGDHIDPICDLTARFELPNLGNVLNLLLLPIGATFGRDIKLWGFDGRAPKDVLFWANSEKQSYPELMPSLRVAHPAFFNALVPGGDGRQYVQNVHGDALDRALTAAESRGFRFEMLHHSWTPTLAKRFRGSPPAELPAQRNPEA